MCFRFMVHVKNPPELTDNGYTAAQWKVVNKTNKEKGQSEKAKEQQIFTRRFDYTWKKYIWTL